MTYEDQLKEIKRLTKSIEEKAKQYVKKSDQENYPYYEDLLNVISELKGANDFLI